MEPRIIRENGFVEVIGHYDDEALCAKMTLLAELYAVEHRDGYARFKAEDAPKLSLVDRRLEFAVGAFVHGFGLSESMYLFKPDGTIYDSTDIGTMSTTSTIRITSDTIMTISSSSSSCVPITTYKLSATQPEHVTRVNDTSFSVENSYTVNLVLEAAPSGPSVDMSTLSGWSSVSSGSHTLTIRAKADGYRTSEASTGVTFTKS